jgi:cell division protein FtsB
MNNAKVVTMSPQELKQFENMQGDIDQIKRQMVTMGASVDKVYFALMGNEITGKDQSLVGRVGEIEEDMKDLKQKVDNIATEAAKSKVYLMVMWGAIGFAAACIFTIAIQKMF